MDDLRQSSKNDVESLLGFKIFLKTTCTGTKLL